jgi:hypothetical protein
MPDLLFIISLPNDFPKKSIKKIRRSIPIYGDFIENVFNTNTARKITLVMVNFVSEIKVLNIAKIY